jgi:predicted esterase
VLALHGYGRDEASFARTLRRRFRGPVPWVWIVPRAPYRVHPERGKVGYAWLVGSAEQPDREGMDGTERFLAAVLRKVSRQVSIDPRRVALIGFSQGGFAAGVTALRCPRRYQGAVVLGAYVNSEMVPRGLARARGTRLFFLHGTDDAVVPHARPRQSAQELSRFGIDTHLEIFPGAHEITPTLAAAARRRLAEMFSIRKGSGGMLGEGHAR